jgi:hypothetical protein
VIGAGPPCIEPRLYLLTRMIMEVSQEKTN